jgi:ADP-ribose pyrophosphatase YjhB (NUDIX family)
VDRRKPLLLNIGESVTDAVLREVAEKLGRRVFVKPRLADVVNVDRSGLSNDEYSYALKAHLDFVVARESDGHPDFAVEFDGPYHGTDAIAARRDAMKNAICQRLGLPLLRIDADYLQTVKGFRLLAWLVELWFLNEAFDEAQARGEVPWDEAFDAYSIVEPRTTGGLAFPFALADEAQRAIWQAYGEGVCLQPVPDRLYRTTKDSGEAYAMLRLPGDRWIISRARIRAFRFPPVTPGELAEELATVGVAAKLAEVQRGVGVAVGRAEYDAVVANLKDGIRSGWSFGFGGGLPSDALDS